MKTHAGFKFAKQIVMLMFFILLPGSNAQCDMSGSKLVMDSLGHDFKEVTEEASVSHVFKAKNMGDKALEINKVETT